MDYQEALVALEESVSRSSQEPADAPRGTHPLRRSVNSKQRRPRDDADMPLPGYCRQQTRKRTQERQRPNP